MANFNDLFSPKPASRNEMPKQGNYKVTLIKYDQLRQNDRQYCDGTTEEIENLADVIAADGQILQPLIVRKTEKQGIYEIIAGHKRWAADKLLVENRGLKKYEMMPCYVTAKNDVQARFALISSNAHHQKTPYELMHELEEMKYLLENYPEEFPDLQKGRMVERLGKQFGLAKTVVGEYQTIAKNLCDKGMELFRNSLIEKSAAVALAGLDVPEQEKLIDNGVLSYKDIKAYKKSMKSENIKESRKDDSNSKAEKPAEENEDVVPESGTSCLENKTENEFDIAIVKYILDDSEKELKDYIEAGGIPEMTIQKKKIIVAALKCMLKEMEK